MRIIVCLAWLSLFYGLPAWCYGNDNSELLLNKVAIKLSAEQWVSSQSALVNVNINAGVTDKALANIQEDVLKKLKQLANQGEWHITQFDRSLDQSGLEKVQIAAQVRLPSSALPDLRNKAKVLSKQGETYIVDNIQFVPSEEEWRSANTQLRNHIYLQAKEEVERLNKLYPEQKYYVHEVNFLTNPLPMMVPQNAMVQSIRVTEGGESALAVGDKLHIAATVVLAAIQDQTLTKTLH